MSRADWKDFVCRLKTDNVLGAFTDPGDLLDYSLSIVPAAGRMCAINFKTTTTFLCKCQMGRKGENTVCKQEITISAASNALNAPRAKMAM